MPSRRQRPPSAAARRAAALQRAEAAAATAAGGGAPRPAGTPAGAAAVAAPAAPPAPASMLAAEDALIVVWVLFGSRLVTALPGFSEDSGAGIGAGAHAAAAVLFEPSLGLFLAIAAALGPGGWLIVLSMLFCFFTRGPEDVDLDTAVLRRFLFVGPAFWLLGVFALLLNAIRYGGDLLWARLRGHGTAAIELRKGWPGWPLPSHVRRLGALPAILGGELAFRNALAGAAETWFDDGRWGSVFIAAIQTAPAFVLFVVAPRLATGGVLRVLPWVVRFVLYFAAVWAGDHWVARLLG